MGGPTDRRQPRAKASRQGRRGQVASLYRSVGRFAVNQFTAALSSRFAMREEGFEPSPLAGQDPKSCASASSATLAIGRADYLATSVETILSDRAGLPSGSRWVCELPSGKPCGQLALILLSRKHCRENRGFD